MFINYEMMSSDGQTRIDQKQKQIASINQAIQILSTNKKD